MIIDKGHSRARLHLNHSILKNFPKVILLTATAGRVKVLVEWHVKEGHLKMSEVGERMWQTSHLSFKVSNAPQHQIDTVPKLAEKLYACICVAHTCPTSIPLRST
jgi:hypothetical protein